MNSTRFVFFDFNGKRWKRIWLLTIVSCILVFALLVIFVRSLLVLPKLRKLDALTKPAVDYKVLTQLDETIKKSPPPPDWLHPKADMKKALPRKESAPEDPIVLSFYAPWDGWSFASLEANYGQITHVAPEWFSMKSFEEPLIPTTDDDRLVEFASSTGVKLVPQITNLSGNDWQPEVVEELARNPERREVFFSSLLEHLKDMNAHGLLVDWEQVDPAYQQEFTGLLSALADTLHNEGLELWLCIPVGNDIRIFDLEALSGIADYFVALLFDENGELDKPGPIASLPWWNEWLEVLLEHGEPGKWIIGIGNYGYDWSQGKPAATMRFTDAMLRAGLAKLPRISSEAPFFNPHFAFEEGDETHSVWLLDAVTFRDQMVKALSRKVKGVALYRLGTEDPDVWRVIADPNITPAGLEVIPSGDGVAQAGDGDFLTIADERLDGHRKIEVISEDAWAGKYDSFPKYRTVYHRGAEVSHKVALTFDDGPDANWTPAILDTLKSYNVKAGFFVVGENALEHPDLVRRILDEGHELGNHSYSHPDLSQVTDQRILFELNATQRILEGIAGISTLLFRPPYHADRQPQSFDQLSSILLAQQVGYIPVTESVDTEDWNTTDPDDIVQAVQERRGEGNVILFHDGGGDRSATVAALPRVIEFLRTRGDEIVPLNSLINLPREGLMPPIPTDDSAESRLVAQTGLRIVRLGEEFLWAFMIGTSVILFLRMLIIMYLAARQKVAEQRVFESPVPSSRAPVSVLIAAYNEAKVIRSTLQSILDSDYEGPMEVLVVDDGSTDNTSAIVAGFSESHPNVRLIRQENMGKAHALDRAINEARYEYIVMLDADTHFNREAIRLLIIPLAEENVGAVSGHVKVGNPVSWITRFQSLEYICGFNLDRRAYDYTNAITVVPGAASSFKRSAIIRAGGIGADTLAEDTDLTLYLHRAGYEIRYVSPAIARTEAPDSVRALVKQRVRWAFGTLQCLWKHRDLLCNFRHPGLGFLSLPSMWFCHVFLVALVPIVDLMLVISLFAGSGAAALDYMIIFFALEFILAFFSCVLEGEKLTASLRIFPMRILYRPLLCFAVWTAILRALKGAWYSWGKLDRKGTVLLNKTPIKEEMKEVA